MGARHRDALLVGLARARRVAQHGLGHALVQEHTGVGARRQARAILPHGRQCGQYLVRRVGISVDAGDRELQPGHARGQEFRMRARNLERLQVVAEAEVELPERDIDVAVQALHGGDEFRIADLGVAHVQRPERGQRRRRVLGQRLADPAERAERRVHRVTLGGGQPHDALVGHAGGTDLAGVAIGLGQQPQVAELVGVGRLHAVAVDRLVQLGQRIGVAAPHHPVELAQVRRCGLRRPRGEQQRGAERRRPQARSGRRKTARPAAAVGWN